MKCGKNNHVTMIKESLIKLFEQKWCSEYLDQLLVFVLGLVIMFLMSNVDQKKSKSMHIDTIHD